jgi:hypothetical protein
MLFCCFFAVFQFVFFVFAAAAHNPGARAFFSIVAGAFLPVGAAKYNYAYFVADLA